MSPPHELVRFEAVAMKIDWPLDPFPKESEALVATAGGTGTATIWVFTNPVRHRDHTSPVLGEALRNLVRHREFLSLQLAHAHGNIADDDMTAIFDEYLTTQKLPPHEIVHRGEIISAYVPELDVEVLASMLNVDLGEALDAVKEAHGG